MCQPFLSIRRTNLREKQDSASLMDGSPVNARIGKQFAAQGVDFGGLSAAFFSMRRQSEGTDLNS
jgi:hypothetical protein